jgi:hypothetical protein
MPNRDCSAVLSALVTTHAVCVFTMGLLFRAILGM